MSRNHRAAAIVGAVAAAAVAMGGCGAVAALVCVAGTGYGVCVVDLRERRIPTPLVRIGMAGLVAVSVVQTARSADLGPIGDLAVGALLLGATVATVHLAAPGRIGFGDVRLAAFIGAATGIGTGSVTAALAVGLLASLAALALMAVTRRRSLPYGPFLVATSIAAFAVAAVNPGFWR